MTRPKIATLFLAGCFGCHMSILDNDERLFKLFELVDLGASPLDDLKSWTEAYKIGLIEGGCSNEENVEKLRSLRDHTEILVALGDCATMGNVPALRNAVPLKECMEQVYLNAPGVYNPSKVIPNDEELPLLLDKVYPCHEVVKIDYMLAGCPPSADSIWNALTALLENRQVDLPYELLKYD